MKTLFTCIFLTALTATILMNRFGKTAKEIYKANPTL